MVSSKLEVLVDFGPQPDQRLLNHTLNVLKSQAGVKQAEYRDGAIVVETTLPNQCILDTVARSSGKRAVLQGFGDGESAVAMVSSQGSGGGVMGILRFQQVGESLIVDGTVDALPPGGHGLHVAADGNLSQGCSSIGPHFNPYNKCHGMVGTVDRHAGDLGNIVADGKGRAAFRIVDNILKVSDIIGRAVAITERPDDFGKGDAPTSKIDGNSGPPIACGIIARSAGIFQNPKRICQCDGVVVWDERDRPLAGKGRRCCGGKQESGQKPCCKV